MLLYSRIDSALVLWGEIWVLLLKLLVILGQIGPKVCLLLEFLKEERYQSPWIQLDLSTDGPKLPTGDLREVEVLQEAIFGRIERSGGTVGYGGYGEKRAWYQNSPLFSDDQGDRTIHLGVDLWVPVGTSILAPVTGKVHSFQNNDHFLDYGSTIILEHQTEQMKWYSLYGHLSFDSLSQLQIGQTLELGEKLCEVGDASENGGWVPHLHFQLMLEIGSHSGDYPGVCRNDEWEFYKKNCPDPALLLRPVLELEK